MYSTPSHQQLQCPRRDFFHFPKPPQSFIPAREHSLLWPNEFHTAGREGGHILLRDRVQPHLAVHRRGQEHLRFGVQRQRDASQGVIRDSVRQFRDIVGRGRRDEQQIRLV